MLAWTGGSKKRLRRQLNKAPQIEGLISLQPRQRQGKLDEADEVEASNPLSRAVTCAKKQRRSHDRPAPGSQAVEGEPSLGASIEQPCTLLWITD